MSDDDPKLDPVSRARAKVIADLDRASARREHGLFRIEGWRALTSAVQAGVQLEEIVVRKEVLDPRRLALLQSAKTGKLASVRPRGMARLTSVLQDQGVVATSRIRLAAPSDLTDCRHVLALNGVQDPGNVGTLIRSAAWFGIEAVVGDVDTADFFNPKVVRATAGAVWDVALARSERLAADLADLKKHGFSVFGADLGGEDTPDWHRADPAILVLGSEGHGLSDAVRAVTDGLVHLSGRRRPESGVESLNVATAGSILMARWAD